MKKALLTFMLLGLLGCREASVPVWITDHRHPIVCMLSSHNNETNWNRYTLFDADGNVFDTGYCPLILPDTIK